MTRRPKRKRGRRDVPLKKSARKAETGRGWAASQGVRLARAQKVGATVPSLWQVDPRRVGPRCTVEGCTEEPAVSLEWCQRHADRARALGVDPPRRTVTDA